MVGTMKPPILNQPRYIVGVVIYWQNEPGNAIAKLLQGGQESSFQCDSARNDHMVIPVTPGIPAIITLNGEQWWNGIVGDPPKSAALSDANIGLRNLAIQNMKNAIGAAEAIK